MHFIAELAWKEKDENAHARKDSLMLSFPCGLTSSVWDELVLRAVRVRCRLARMYAIIKRSQKCCFCQEALRFYCSWGSIKNVWIITVIYRFLEYEFFMLWAMSSGHWCRPSVTMKNCGFSLLPHQLFVTFATCLFENLPDKLFSVMDDKRKGLILV